MKPVIDIGVYCHRFSDFQVDCISSVAQHTKQSYNLIVVCEPGSCHKNMNRVLDRSMGDYLILMDEDVQIEQDNWLDLLTGDLESVKDAGVVGTFVARSQAALQAWSPEMATPGTWPEERTWIPAHVMCFDMRRVREFLRFDECIPWIMGMTDVDACLQIRHIGLRVMIDRRVVVYHPTRDDEETRAKEQRPTIAEQQKYFPDQFQYMSNKWGPALAGLAAQGMVEI